MNEKTNSRSRREISRLLTAAVINENFCRMLLSNPEKALQTGFRGEVFHLASEEKRRLLAIHASSLADFAAKLPNI
jgi:hypothetical protein